MELANLIWMLLAAAMVMLMQGGFCFLESGLVRAKNSINVAMKNIADFCVAGLLFWMVGFGLMFGKDWSGVAGSSFFLLEESDNAWLLTFFLFQMVFCGTATTIISGAAAERMRFSVYLILSGIVSAVIYPIFGHWAWGGLVEGTGSGWMAEMGFIDFAGSTVVHSVGGWTALATVIIVGPRVGRFDDENGRIQGHNFPMAALGTLLLWFGWFGFNGGSTLAVDGSIPLILVNTNLAAAAGGVCGLIVSRCWHGRPKVTDIMNGVIAGLVGITAACHMVNPTAAIVIGGVAAMVSLFGTVLLERFKVDDVIGAVPAHAMAGCWGTLAVALLGKPEFFAEGMTRLGQLQIQAIGVGTCFVWSCTMATLALGVIQLFIPLRVSVQAEMEGLNVHEHGASTEILDLLDEMRTQSIEGDFSKAVTVEPHTEVGQIAQEYNKVLHKVVEEIERRESLVGQLQHAEEKFRTIFENATEGIFRTTPNGNLLVANPALARILGYESAAQLISEITDVGTQLYVDTAQRQVIMEALQRDHCIYDFPVLARRRNGEEITVQVNARYYDRADGTSAYIEGSLIDISERVQSENLRKEKEAAEAASRAKSTFLATMSHEIRTPLNGVIGMLELLADTELNRKQRHYTSIAKSSADSLLSLINDILDFSKIEAGKLELNEEEFDFSTLVEDVADMFCLRAEQKGLELSCHILPDVAARVKGDSERLRQILVNLIGNALKFTEAGEVRIEARVEESSETSQQICLSVQDTGIGIPYDIQERLFLPFEQADGSTTRKFGGTGLGLAICRQLIDLMGGTIDIDSAPGVGTTFFCHIPFEVVPGKRGSRRTDSRIEGTRILAVDDNENNRIILQSLLSSWGALVKTAENAEQAFELLTAAEGDGDPFAMAILDYRMPDVDGAELARRIKSTPEIADCHLIMLTSSDSELSREELRAIGIKSCSSKPIRSSRLFDDLITAIYEVEHAVPISEPQSLVIQETPPEGEQRVLIVDDNEINQIVTQEIVEQYGWRCRVANNGKEAIDLLKRRPFDMVLMDCQMPVMDGFAATAEIRRLQASGELPASLPIIALTANAVKGDRDRCLSAGMDDYVPKPINPQLLVQKMVQLANSHASRSESGEATASAGEDADVFDPVLNAIEWNSLIERCAGSREVAEKVLRKFQNRVVNDVAAIEESIASGDWLGSGRLVHGLKGSAGNVSAVKVSEAALQIERAIKTNPESQDFSAGLEELKERVDQCLNSIEQCLASSAV